MKTKKTIELYVVYGYDCSIESNIFKIYITYMWYIKIIWDVN